MAHRGARRGELMRLVTYKRDGVRVLGVVVDIDGIDYVHDVDGTLEGVLSNTAFLDQARAGSLAAPSQQLTLLADVQLVAPVVPSKIVCLGYNYRWHVADGADPTADDPEFPDVFLKTGNVLIGPEDAVQIPRTPADVDYEGEIAIVIGRRAKDVSVEIAMDYVGGYTLFNDVTARDWQRRTSQWALGKSFDTFGQLGPWVVTADDVPDPHDLMLEVVRESAVTVSQSTSTMIFSMAFVVSYLSQVMTLEPGDIISTGSPQKLAAAQEAHTPLGDGDAVTIRVAGIGELTTTFRAQPGGSS
jgi:2-keto-4-pentenoate hydratase/2-oxohepta-3-ene-1,7-dioic acid hydratase in catechol pathway